MKAERRHELKTNALAKGLEGFPDYWREYGGKVLMVVLVGAIVFLLVRYWNDRKAKQAEEVATSLDTVHVELQQLQQLPLRYFGAPPAALADQRQKISQQADEAITTILDSAKDPKVIANAYLARGDLNWMLANLPEIPGADTQPALKLDNRDSLLQQAAAAYEKVLGSGSGSSVGDQFAARVGLAAIAENQGQWDKAREQYQAIAGATDFPAALKDYAVNQLASLPGYETPALIVPKPEEPPAAATTQATSRPETFGPQAPAVAPSTAPSTRPTSEPTSQP